MKLKFRDKKCFFPSRNRLCCAAQHDFLRHKKIFRIVKCGAGRKKTGADAPVGWMGRAVIRG
ncbi:hypothetical protein, partial [Burkholderia sp. LMG 13014]